MASTLAAAAFFSYMLPALALPAASTFENSRRDDTSLAPRALETLAFASFGDSWASGVTYDTSLNYDNDEGCRRIIDAYSAQMYQDNTWPNGRALELHFLACSGSRIGGIGGQAKYMSADEAFGTVTIGGNDAGFFDVVSNCVYQQGDGNDPRTDYGPDFPDPNGRCAKSIANANSIINDWGKFDGGVDFQTYIAGSYGAIYDEAITKKKEKNQNQDFKLFVTGYPTLFNQDDQWCNDKSFGFWFFRQPKLTTQLRAAINDLVKAANNRIYHAVQMAAGGRGGKIYYVDITDAFDGHRFCERNEPQYNMDTANGNPWMWNLQALSGKQIQATDANDKGSQAAAQLLLWDDKTSGAPVPGDLSAQSNVGSPIGSGITSRPFHPTKRGHMAIKDAVIYSVKQNAPELYRAVVAADAQSCKLWTDCTTSCPAPKLKGCTNGKCTCE